MLLTAVLLAAAAAPADDPAEALFRKMEKKVADAQTLSLGFKADAEPKKLGGFKGRVVAAPGNKIRFEFEWVIEDRPVKMTMVSDGAKMRTTEAGKGSDPVQDTPKELGPMVRAVVSRTGVLTTTFLLSTARSDDPAKKDEFDREKTFAVSGFKLVGKRKEYGKADGGETEGVEYKLTVKGMEQPLAVTVWIDTKTDLPVKRVVTAVLGDNTKMTITETYTDVTVGGKVDEKDFVLK
jgi:outer membrane lipoprotein-sorting protein